jgi:hypothetical protein
MGSRAIRIAINLPINQNKTDDKRFEFSLLSFPPQLRRMGEQTGSETCYNENIKPQNMIKHHINMLLSKLDSYAQQTVPGTDIQDFFTGHLIECKKNICRDI